MKSLTQFLEAQKFLVKGHTKTQIEDCIDLDLPSCIKWATCNIGANKPEESGLLFQWGLVEGWKYEDESNKFLSNYKYKKLPIYKKYEDGETLKPEDDAAYQVTKGKFRMPTVDEMEELLRYTNNEWTEINGVTGRKFISKKDESKWIFLPAVGCYSDNEFKYNNKSGSYWSSTSYSSVDYFLMFNSQACKCSNYLGYEAKSIRGILNK